MLANILHMHLPLWEATVRLGTALFFAGIIGWEREAKGRSAGLRTHMLVALGAAGFALLGMELIAAASTDAPGAQSIELLRIIEAVATGVGFLGAGAIMQSGAKVKGLTTAASIWVVSAVGVACGSGYWIVGLLLTIMGLLTLTAIQWLAPDPGPEHSKDDES